MARYQQQLSDHLHVLGKFHRRLEGEMPADQRTRLESVVKTYERLYLKPTLQEAFSRGAHAKG